MMKFAKKALIAAVLVASTTPALAASNDDSVFYYKFLTFIQAQFAFEGAEFGAFSTLNLDAVQMKALSDSFASLNSAQLSLVQYLQSKITIG